MKLHLITFIAAAFAAQFATAQVETGTLTDTTAPIITEATQAQQEAALKAEKERLKAEQQLQKEQEKALKAQEKAAKEKAKAEKAARKAEEKARKEQERAAKEKAKAEKVAQKNRERLAKANSQVSKVEAKITKAKNDLAQEENKFNIKKAKGALSPQDEAKLKGKILKRQQKINDLQLDLVKAKERVTKYSL